MANSLLSSRIPLLQLYHSPRPPAAFPPLGVGVCGPKNGRWPGASPGLFGDIVSHLPDCCSFIRIGVGCGRALSQRLSQRKPLSVFDTCPAKLVIWHPVIPNGSYLLHGPRQTLPGCVLIAILGDPNRVRAGSAERTRLGDGGGSSYRLRGSGGRHSVPRVEPMTRGEISRWFFQFTVP